MRGQVGSREICVSQLQQFFGSLMEDSTRATGSRLSVSKLAEAFYKQAISIKTFALKEEEFKIQSYSISKRPESTSSGAFSSSKSRFRQTKMLLFEWLWTRMAIRKVIFLFSVFLKIVQVNWYRVGSRSWKACVIRFLKILVY